MKNTVWIVFTAFATFFLINESYSLQCYTCATQRNSSDHCEVNVSQSGFANCSPNVTHCISIVLNDTITRECAMNNMSCEQEVGNTKCFKCDTDLCNNDVFYWNDTMPTSTPINDTTPVNNTTNITTPADNATFTNNTTPVNNVTAANSTLPVFSNSSTVFPPNNATATNSTLPVFSNSSTVFPPNNATAANSTLPVFNKNTTTNASKGTAAEFRGKILPLFICSLINLLFNKG